jgi:hypothetical protein
MSDARKEAESKDPKQPNTNDVIPGGGKPGGDRGSYDVIPGGGKPGGYNLPPGDDPKSK